MYRKTLFVAAAVAAILFFAGSIYPVYAKNEGNLTEDLNKVLKSFNKQGKNDSPALNELYDATGTLIFFDNTESVGPSMSLDELTGKKKPNFIQKTLDNAKQRLFNRENRQQRQDSFIHNFVNPKQSEEVPQNIVRKGPRYLPLNYDGEKTVINIPPDTMIEVPFVDHVPYFFSRIEIYADGSIGVTETIQRVVAPEEKPFYGIDRYFSKYHGDRAGNVHRTQLTVLEAYADGRPVEAKVIPSLFGIRVSMHDEFPLPPGVHVYTITYLLPQKIAEIKTQDGNGVIKDIKELIWSVTGQHWNMPVTRAGAVVIFPKDAEILSQSALTGSILNQTQFYKAKKDKEGNLSFTLTYPLSDGEGLTIMANWRDKNPVQVPGASWLDKFIVEHGTTAASVIAFLFILSYYIATWLSLKKDQVGASDQIKQTQKGDFAPAVLHYALNKEANYKSLFILLTSMASKGFIVFGEDPNGTLLIIKQTDKEKNMLSLEKKVSRLLFSKNETSFAMTEANALRLTRIMDNVKISLKKEYNRKFVTLHQSYFWFGILMAVVSLVFISALSLFGVITLFTALSCVALFIPVYFISLVLHQEASSGNAKRNWFSLVLLGIILFPFAAGLFILLCFYMNQTTFMTAFTFLLTMICIAVFYSLLKSPTMLGKSVLENIDGYKIYLSAQNDTMLTAMRNAVQKIKSLYNRHLPFAAAFDLDRQWTQRFAAFSGEENQLKPDWYKGKLPFDENFTTELFQQFEKAMPPEKANKNQEKRAFRKNSAKK